MSHQIRLYNTAVREITDFEPLNKEENKVSLYSCGPTVYGDPHIGNMRAYVFADILKKTLQHVGGFTVDHVMNITDVGHLTDDGDQGEDKMEKGAKRENKTVREVARMYEDNFKKYSDDLGIAPPRVYTRATEYMTAQIDMVQQLIEKGYTYVIPGDGIYMDTTQVDDYGRIAKLDIEGMKSHHRGDGAQIDSSKKRQITDFALRKFSPENEQRAMEWIFEGERAGTLLTDDVRSTLTEEEQTTRGFPGRHIECSAMADAELGNDKLQRKIDIHTGGIDHIPVHHTNEIAQAECALGITDWVQYWMHCQFLQINGSKVSKSKGDDLSIPGIVAKGYDPLDLRYFYLTGHYRSELDFSWDSLDAAKKSRENLIQRLANFAYKETDPKNLGDSTLYDEMSAALAKDLDTVEVISIINNARKDGLNIQQVKDIFQIDKEVLGLGLEEAFQLYQKIAKAPVPEEIKVIADNRSKAKAEKDRATADALRDKLANLGWEVKDLPSGGYKVFPID